MRNVSTNALLQELKSRGLRTDLVIGIEQIDAELKEIKGVLPAHLVNLSQQDKESILESLSLEWHKQEIKDEIINKIFSIANEKFLLVPTSTVDI